MGGNVQSVLRSTGTGTASLQSRNFHFGTGDVEKGPTNTTLYYAAIDPPGGVPGANTVYINKASGGPSIYTFAHQPANIINFTNALAGSSFTTTKEVVDWYMTQTDKTIVSRRFRQIPNSAKALYYLDIDQWACFSPDASTTTTYDLSEVKGSASCVVSAYEGYAGGFPWCIVFDGISSYLICTPGNILDTLPAYTISVWFKSGTTLTDQMIFSTPGNVEMYLNGSGTSMRVDTTIGGNTVTLYAYSLTPETWYNATVYYADAESNVYLFINNVVQDTVNINGNSSVSTKFLIGGDNLANPTPFKGRFANIALWGVALTDHERLDWWNECKADFGY
jgi:hypothetical protein